jgi:hypothetical protein
MQEGLFLLTLLRVLLFQVHHVLDGKRPMGSPHFLLVIKQKQLKMLLSYLNIQTNEDLGHELFLVLFILVF